VKKLFAEIPDEERLQIQKLSLRLGLLAEEKSKLQVQVVGLSQQNAGFSKEIDCLRAQIEA
jgi:cell division protein FtsB